MGIFVQMLMTYGWICRNERMIQDKYCLRGAEWGVGDCSTEGMSDQEREDFISELKKRTGAE
jgi:hypothetical protein